jgi:deoxyribonuclease V
MSSAARFSAPHSWDVSPAEAIALQKQLRTRIDLTPLTAPVRWIAGVDAGFTDGGETARAAIVLFRYPELEVEETQLAFDPVRFPYVPGLLSFRELPVVLKALNGLQRTPDLLLCDGQGIAHPRRLGIGAHLGLVTGIPSIGVGKSRLTGRYREPGESKGDWTPLLDGREEIGRVLRTRPGIKPLFISPGHRTSMDDAIAWVLACTPRYRLPEPIRAADRLASNRGSRQRSTPQDPSL